MSTLGCFTCLNCGKVNPTKGSSYTNKFCNNSCQAQHRSRSLVREWQDAKEPTAWRQVPEYIKKYELQVYNKWGEMVFKTNNPYQQWMPENPIPGQYVYYCKVSDIYNRFKEIKGTVLLIR